MSLVRRFYPLLVSVLLHGAVLWAYLSTERFEKYDVIEMSLYTGANSVSPSKNVQKKSIQDSSAVLKKAQKDDDLSTVVTEGEEIYFGAVSDELVTEEPKIISEPRIKARTEEARRNAYTGIAKLKIWIDSEGNVRDAKLVNSLKYGLNERAIELAKQIKLTPAKVQGKPVSIVRDFTITFGSTESF